MAKKEGDRDATPLNPRFVASTRGRLLGLLRRASRTVEELAAALHLTDNAVRAQLSTLEEQGLVQQEGVRRGVRKPSFAYQLTPQAEQLFPRAYGLMLSLCLDELAPRMSAQELDEFLWALGHRLAAGREIPAGDLRRRLEMGVAVVNELGGLMELEETDRTYTLCGYSCPLLLVVQKHPEACRIAQALLNEIAGVPVEERCERSASLACRFEVSKAGYESPAANARG